MMTTFEDKELGSAFDEMCALGRKFSEEMLCHCHKVDRGEIDFRKLLVFATYEGVEMFLAMIGQDFIVYAVEIDEQNNLTLTIMFAGQHGRSARAGLHSWNGTAYQQLVSGIIQARAAAHFD